MEWNLMNLVYFGNSVQDYLVAMVVLLVGLLIVKIGVRSFVSYLKKLAATTASNFDDFLVRILEKVALSVSYFVCFYISIQTLKLSAFLSSALNTVSLAVVLFFVVRLLIIILDYAINVYLVNQRKDPAVVRSFDGIVWVLKLLIWSLAVIILLDNLGYKVSALLAGLGIGGIAVAIAAQALLKDFFSYFSIVFDQPFKLGDFIIIGDFMGTVERIGIKTSRIRSLGGELLIFSNTDLTDSRVRNYKVMEKRRVMFRLGVTYQTSLAQIKEIPKIIENIVKNTEETLFDRAHFFSYGDFSLIIEVVYYVLSPDYNKYMDIQQSINFKIKEEFEKRGIEFAYPTQTVFLNKIQA